MRATHESGGVGGGVGHSPEQEHVSRRILSLTCYYEILGIAKNDPEETIKKAYKKLALQLHPDKNSAPSAEEAFKKVSRAFQCLADAQRRKAYDQYGTEEEPVEASGGAQHYEHDVMTPEELFRAFFGVDLAGGGGGGFQRARVYRRQQQPRGHTRGGPTSNNEEQHRLYGLIQLIPVILLFTITFFSNLLPSAHQKTPTYSFSEGGEYSILRKSQRLDVPYFVPKDFDQLMQKNKMNLGSFEDDLELLLFTSRCEQEERDVIRQVKLAEYYKRAGSADEINRLYGLKRPSCDQMQQLRYIVGQRQQRQHW
eukprot:GHVS01083310.1.p1 GENE.GHVS01083310.1~~GHVS01083310.1.p1  ORF type:complete len:311 (+),score=53.84 GHVS01083310.1:70-1002(+)